MTLSSLCRGAAMGAAAFFLSACAGQTGSPTPSESALFARSIKGAACAAPRASAAHCLVQQIEQTAGRAISGWGPADFQARYNLPSGTKGSGQIVAVVEAYDNPDAASDLTAYRAQYGLGTAVFAKYNQKGEIGNYPPGDAGWGVQIDLDVEMVSAACPLCTIYLVEANSAAVSDLGAAEREAVRLGARIVNSSWGCAGSTKCVSKKYFAARGVVYLAPTGNEVEAPAAFDNVVAVGGTTLSKNGSQYNESISSFSLGGCATGIKKPKWQNDGYCQYRLTNDVSAVSNDAAEYDSYGNSGWISVSGTGVSSPLLAGVFGLAGNAAKQKGGRTFWLSRHHDGLYTLSGSCTGYGYGQYTTCGGWGSPNGIGAF